MRRTALLLAVALTALLGSSVFWRPLRPGPAPEPGAGPLAYLRHNLDLPPLDRPAPRATLGPVAPLSPVADGTVAVRTPEASNKTAQLCATKPLQPRPELTFSTDQKGSGSDRKAGRSATKALKQYAVPKPQPACCPMNPPQMPELVEPSPTPTRPVALGPRPAGLADMWAVGGALVIGCRLIGKSTSRFVPI